MKAIRLFMLVALVALVGCKDGSKFVVELDCVGLGEQSVTMTYYADGRVQQVEGRAHGDGKVSLEGEASEPTLVDISLTASGQPLLTVVAQNGDRLKVKLSIDDPSTVRVEGSATAEAMAAFMAEHAADDAAALNEAIAAYVKAHPGDVASTALLVSHYRVEGSEQLADSLLNVIAPEARPLNMIESFNAVLSHRLDNEQHAPVRQLTLTGVRDSAVTVSPQKHRLLLLAFSGAGGSRAELTRELRTLRREHSEARLGIVEISLLADSAAWRREVRADSLRWTQTWVPGAAAAQAVQRLGVVTTPYYIVADSLGHQLLRTTSAGDAAALIRRRLE